MGPPSDRVQQLPPPAYGAHHQGPTTPEHLASQMAATELSSYRERRDTGASSSSDVLRFKIGLAYDQHTSLHDSIRPLVHIPARLTETQEQVYVLKGLLTTLRASWKRTDAHVKASHLRYKKLLPAFGGRKMLLPARRHKLDAARSKWEREHVERGRLEEEILDKEERLRNQEDDIAEMELAIQRLQSLEQQLDMLDDDLFQGPTAGCEQEDKAEQMVAVLLRTHQSLLAESEREVRCRQKLQRCQPCLESVLAQLKKALAITLDAGIPTNQKYSRQLFVNSGPIGVAKQITPLVQFAKTQSGKGHTLFAEARGSQFLVRPLPSLTLMDLNRLPGKSGTGASSISQPMSEQAMHGSLETSYAQMQAQVAHVKAETSRSWKRTTFFRERCKQLKEEERKAALHLRERRRQVVKRVQSGEERLEDSSGAAALSMEAGAAVQEDDEDDDATLADDPPDEAQQLNADADIDEGAMFNATQDLAGNPISQNRAPPEASGSTGPIVSDSGTGMGGLLAPPPFMSRQSSSGGESSAEGDDHGLPTLRNPYTAPTPSNDKAGGGASYNDAASSVTGGPLDPRIVTAKSTRALRRILRECVRSTNTGDSDAEEMPTFWDLSS